MEKAIQDCDYNLLKAITKKANAVTKYDQYIEDAEKAGHDTCADLWRELKEEDKRHVEDLKQVLEQVVEQDELE